LLFSGLEIVAVDVKFGSHFHGINRVNSVIKPVIRLVNPKRPTIAHERLRRHCSTIAITTLSY